MIDFACKSFKLERVIRCGLGLTIADFKVLEFLLKQDKELDTKDIAAGITVNLSTVQRAVKKLAEKELIQRRQENLDDGGYLFYYSIRSKQHIRNMIMQIVNAWVKKVDTELRKW
ncbi:MAG: MarR family transcriptional regulator [Nanoarchaeota archaeon]|nr:MarR family transcriptional regulator [Nanoarchaeota archaeon]MBU1704215.1 MarR family transcriptional regulator [Nanoarchaeota archaeon]